MLLNEFDSGRWRRFILTGPSQSGKTLGAFLIPLLYHLFELKETVVCGVPDLAMVSDLWADRILPIIELTRYRNLIPLTGEGVRGGKIENAVRFPHGPVLRFMTGGASDKGVASFTSRVLLVTEAEGFDRQTKTSKEGTKLAQLEARTLAYVNRMVYLECTTTTNDGLMEREYAESSQGRIMLPCPHCGHWVAPGREHLHGWQESETAMDARDSAALACPDCGATWTEAERGAAVQASCCVHRGQSVTEAGSIDGPMPRTDTLGFRWSAVHNLLQPIGETGREEWMARRAQDNDAAERALCQFRWCIPSRSDSEERDIIEPGDIVKRATMPSKGTVPEWARHVTVGIDCGRYECHWAAVAWGLDGTSHVLDYGVIQVHSKQHGDDLGLEIALREVSDLFTHRWPGGRDRQGGSPQALLVDSGWLSPAVYSACRDSSLPMMPSKGYGSGRVGMLTYHAPKAVSKTTSKVGPGWHVVRLSAQRTKLVEFDADNWKTWTWARLQAPMGSSGAMTIHEPDMRDEKNRRQAHLQFARQLCSETRSSDTGKWKRAHHNNHWWDALVLASVAASWCGVTVDSGGSAKASQPSKLTSWSGKGGWS